MVAIRHPVGHLSCMDTRRFAEQLKTLLRMTIDTIGPHSDAALIRRAALEDVAACIGAALVADRWPSYGRRPNTEGHPQANTKPSGYVLAERFADERKHRLIAEEEAAYGVKETAEWQARAEAAEAQIAKLEEHTEAAAEIWQSREADAMACAEWIVERLRSLQDLPEPARTFKAAKRILSGEPAPKVAPALPPCEECGLEETVRGFDRADDCHWYCASCWQDSAVAAHVALSGEPSPKAEKHCAKCGDVLHEVLACAKCSGKSLAPKPPSAAMERLRESSNLVNMLCTNFGLAVEVLRQDVRAVLAEYDQATAATTEGK